MSRSRAPTARSGPRAVDRAFADAAAAPRSGDRPAACCARAELAIAGGRARPRRRRPAAAAAAAGSTASTNCRSPGAWREALLRASRWVATPERDTEADPATCRWCSKATCSTCAAIANTNAASRRACCASPRTPPPAADQRRAGAAVRRTVPARRAPATRQAHAAALALLRSLLLVTGGPGTGKTTTIARAAAAADRAGARCRPRTRRASRWPRPPAAPPTAWRRACARRPRSCASSGHRRRAVRRVAERRAHPAPPARHASPAARASATTRRNPLPYDLVVVDEASMVDLPLMCKLVEAVADGARLVLLGDRRPVAVGRSRRRAGRDRRCRRAMATRLPPMLPPRCSRCWPCATAAAIADPHRRASPLHGHRVHLQRGYRQSAVTRPRAARRRGARRRRRARAGAAARRRACAACTSTTACRPARAAPRASRCSRRGASWPTHDAIPRPALALADRSARLLTALARRAAGRDAAQCAHRGSARRRAARSVLPRAPAAGHREQLSPRPVQRRHRRVPARSHDGGAVAWFAGGAEACAVPSRRAAGACAARSR